MFRVFFLIAVLAGCRANETVEPRAPRLTELKAKRDLYLSLLPAVQDEWGFVGTDHCDSLLFSSLLGAAGAVVDIEAAQVAPGQWLRRPVAYPECWKNGKSRSTISRDQLLGLMWYSWAHRRLDIAQDLWSYGESRNWVMGEDSIHGAHTVLNPSYITLLAEIIYKLDGENHFAWRSLPVVFGGCEGFVCHLQALLIALKADVTGALADYELSYLQVMSQRNPNNALYRLLLHKYTDGDIAAAVDHLLDSPIYPSDRLPTSADVCEAWPTQRADNDSSLTPCPEQNLQHSGGDLIFIVFLLER